MKGNLKIDSLKKKTVLFTFVITVLCIVFSAFIVSQIVEKQTTDKYEVDKDAAREFLSYSLAPILDLYDYKQVERVIKSCLIYESIASITVLDDSGTLIRSVAEQNVSAKDLYMEKCSITSKGKQIGSVEIGFSKEYINKQIRTTTGALIFGLMGFFILVALGLYVFMNRSIIEPLQAFTKTVKEMNSGSLSARVKIRGEDEIGVLAVSFNQMADNLEKSHRSLSESEERFRTIFNAVNDAIFVHDLDTGTILDVNSRMCEMYGYSREEARQLDVEALSLGEPPYTQQDALGWIKNAAEVEPQIFEWRAKRKSGDLFWAEVSMRSTEIGGQNRLLVVVRDITERKQAEEALQKAHHELEAKVEERTKNLKDKTEKLERMNKLFVDRELRMKELKEEIKNLKRKM